MKQQHRKTDSIRGVSDLSRLVYNVRESMAEAKRERGDKGLRWGWKRGFLLLYLYGVQDERGHFGPQAAALFLGCNTKTVIPYWSKLISEGFIEELETRPKLKRGYASTRVARLTPWSVGFLLSLWGAYLRRTEPEGDHGPTPAPRPSGPRKQRARSKQPPAEHQTQAIAEHHPRDIFEDTPDPAG